MGNNGFDVRGGDVLVVPPEDQQRRAPGLSQLGGDPSAVERHGGVASHLEQRRPVGLEPTHAESDHPDGRRTLTAQMVDGLVDVGGRPLTCERSHEGDNVASFGSPGAEEQVGSDRRVPLVRQPLADTEQLWRDPVAFVDHDDAGRRVPTGGTSGEVRKGDVRHSPILSWPRDGGERLPLGPPLFTAVFAEDTDRL
jgi:hypothetical protein